MYHVHGLSELQAKVTRDKSRYTKGFVSCLPTYKTIFFAAAYTHLCTFVKVSIISLNAQFCAKGSRTDREGEGEAIARVTLVWFEDHAEPAAADVKGYKGWRPCDVEQEMVTVVQLK